MTPEQITRYQRKAAVAANAWQRTLGEAPTRHALILALAVADLETGLGNVRGHNWGFVHKRSMTPEEASILLGHGIYPTGSDALATARGLLAPSQGASEELFIDDGPIGRYFVWVWAFPSDVEAAAKFLEVLVANRLGVRAVIDTASPLALASAMYASKYFEGTNRDPAANVRAYGARIAEHATRIEGALAGWPAAAPTAATGNLSSGDTERRAGGWWLAGIALVGVGAFFMSRRS
jgi:hypothetical protein